MARCLYRLAAFCAARRRWIISGWVAVLLIAGGLAATGMSFASGGFDIPGTDSARAQMALARDFPSTGTGKQVQMQLVFQVPDGAITDPAPAATVASALQAARQITHVVAVSDPLAATSRAVSSNGQVAVATVTVQGVEDDTALQDQVTTGLDRVAAGANTAGMTAEVGGSVVQQKPSKIGGPTELAGVAIAFLVLLLTFGSLAAAGANMLTALFSVGIGAVSLLAFSGFSPIQVSTPILAVMLGLAVGIDYTLFILSRFRDELRAGRTVEEAVPLAVGTAGSAVVFAGTTVIIALVGLSLVKIPFITEMGIAAAASIAVAVVIALTLLPALLRTLGRRALPRRERGDAPGRSRAVATAHPSALRISFFERWAAFVTRRPLQCLIVAVALLAVLAVPVLSMKTAMSVPGGADPGSSERRAYTLVSDTFGAGYQSPLVVLVEAPDAATQAASVVGTIKGMDHVAAVSSPQLNAGDTAAIISVTSTNGPNDAATSDLVKAIRSATYNGDVTTVAVTGSTAVDIDVNSKLSSALIEYIILIVGLALLLLIVLFRSIIVPIMAALGFLLSLAASFGMTVAIFQWGWLGPIFKVKEGQPILSLLPIIIVGILFGLAMDYQVFLVSRIHGAHRRGLSTTEAIYAGFGRSGTIVAAAATIMAAVFLGFGLGGGSALVASLACALGSGVLVDAFVVRMIVIPATLTLFGQASWWMPRWLDRLLPTIDTEGEGLAPVPPAGSRSAQPVGARTREAGASSD
jgi:RND superfamily putative drug exporter